MEKTHFDELAGRIEGLTRVVMHLTVLLEDAGHINGATLNTVLQDMQPYPVTPQLLIAAKTQREIAQALNSARNLRRLHGHA